jgi:ureidoglycolate lyase
MALDSRWPARAGDDRGMTPWPLHAEPLTPAAFAPFGSVIEGAAIGAAINGGSALRSEAVAALDLVRDGGRAVLALYRAQARTFPFDAVEMERHALSDQVFLPLGEPLRCVVLVAPAGAPPTPEACRAFVTHGHQGVRIAAGTWHHGLLALQDGTWAVLERRGDAVDCDLHPLARPLRLQLG